MLKPSESTANLVRLFVDTHVSAEFREGRRVRVEPIRTVTLPSIAPSVERAASLGARALVAASSAVVDLKKTKSIC